MICNGIQVAKPFFSISLNIQWKAGCGHAAFEVLAATVLCPSDQPDLDNKREINTYGGRIQMKSLKKLTMVLFLGLVLLIPGSTVAADDTKK